jgi:starch-binding outer membrane protein, SusD/RagB family
MKMFKNSARVCIGATMVGLTLLTPSCKKVLDVVPYTSIPDITAFSTAARVDAAMNGVYDAAQSGFYAGGAVRGYPFGAANIEQGDMRGEDMLNDALFYQVTYESTQNSTSANQEFMFNTLYALINKANLMIEGVAGAVTSGVITQATADQYVAEARFLRALAHHELLIHFARPYADGNGSKLGVIYRMQGIDLDADVEAAKAEKRTTVADNYTKLLADLDYAEQTLPATSSQRPFRATKGAAIALKTRVKLHMQDWAGVITEGNKLVSAAAPFTSPIGGFALTANPGDPFVLPGTSVESIFSIRNASTDNGGVNGALPNMYGSAAGGGRGLVRVSPIAYNLPEWPCDDKRRSLLTTYTSPATKTNYLTTKYKDPATSTDPAPQIRYAEVLLNLAEAEARQASGVSARSLALLNAIRGRATTAYAAFATKTDLIKAILVERRIEFLGEGRRWSDIHRLGVDATFGTGGIPAKIGTGSATTAMYSCGAGNTAYTTAVAAIPYADRRFIWPIPLTETQVNPNFEQNTGY